MYIVAVLQLNIKKKSANDLLFQAELKGVSSSISGWIFGVYSLTQFLVSPIVGKIVSTYQYCL